MNVISVDRQKLDLSKSLLNEEDDIDLSGIVNVDGTIVLNENFQVLPLISTFLIEEQITDNLAASSAYIYGLNLSYCLSYLMSLDTFKGFELDEAFITVSKPVLKCYFTKLREVDGLESDTITNRDACIKKFFDDFLCTERGKNPTFREDNPFKDGALTTSGSSKIIEYCSINTLEALILGSKFERERLILQTVFDAGIRKSELKRITRADILEAIDFQKAHFYGTSKENDIVNKGYIPLTISGSKGRGRNFKPRKTLISAATLKRIISYHASPLYKKWTRKYNDNKSTPAFFNNLGKAFSAKNFDRLLDKVCNRALKKRAISKAVSAHKLRHGYAYEVLQSPDFGEDYLDRLVNVQKTLGHNKLSSTEIYTRIPLDLYRKMTDESGAVLTKSEKMEKLSLRTKLKIKLGDQK